MKEPIQTSKGVTELISRIRDEGVEAAQKEADELLRKARAEAHEVRTRAAAEAQELRESAHRKIEAEQNAALEGLRNAARDAMLDLRSRVRSTFERQMRRLVSTTMVDRDLIRSIVLVLAGDAAEHHVKNGDARIFLSPDSFDGDGDGEGGSSAGDDQLRDVVLGIAGDALRQGIELVPATDVHAGARIRLVDENLEIDLTDEAISEVLRSRLLPRYRKIIEQA